MPQQPMIDEDYPSEDDSDFTPDAAPIENASESESEPESEAGGDQPADAVLKRKRIDTADGVEGDFENSGDEAIIHKGKKRQRKVKQTDGGLEEDEGGEGGFVKTRRQRAHEKAERKSRAITGPVTIDVDSLWAQMTAVPLIPSKTDPDQGKENQHPGRGSTETNAPVTQVAEREPDGADASRMVKIKRTYNFAGKIHTEEKLVARDSAEAKLYLASQDPTLAGAQDEDEQPKRNPRKAFHSVFEPIIEGLAQRADLKLGMNIRLELREQQAKAKRLNVVEKSRMDWAGFVDKEGIKDELELAGKSKESYVSRQDFLQRVEAKKDEEARRARIAGRG